MEIKINEETKKSIKIVGILIELVRFEFNVSKEEAEELVEKAADYNINSSADLLNVIEEELGYKPIHKRRRGKKPWTKNI